MVTRACNPSYSGGRDHWKERVMVQDQPGQKLVKTNVVVHSCGPHYAGGYRQEDCVWRLALGENMRFYQKK
jgi:hypothetical protein